jgi:type II secretory pathway component PulL
MDQKNDDQLKSEIRIEIAMRKIKDQQNNDQLRSQIGSWKDMREEGTKEGR